MSVRVRESLNSTGHEQEVLHESARMLCQEHFGRRVFVRGVVEVSNYCRQNCNYCAMRRDNRALDRYRFTLEELLEAVMVRRPPCITDIDIQAGEDPVAVRDVVIPLIRELRQESNLGVTVCLGLLPQALYDELRDAGADYYVLKSETTSAAHYEQIQAPGSLATRLEAIRYLAGHGWNVSSGLIVGLPGQTDAMLAEGLQLLASLPLVGASVSPFISGEDTPYNGLTNGSLNTTINCVALLRQLVPHWFIPAVSAMQIVGNDGYVRALRAGANLTTINLTPPRHREDYPIYKHHRVIMHEERVLGAIEAAGCTPSPVGVSAHLRKRAVACT